MTTLCFLEPLDVLFLRGNRVFGDAGSYGESLLPPWPSVAAGALRSLLYAGDGRVLTDPDDFRITAFHLARRVGDATQAIYALPADLSVSGSNKAPRLGRVRPAVPARGLEPSTPLPCVPVLAEDSRSKPLGGYWLSEAGWRRYLTGETPQTDDLIASKDLWETDFRVGVGLDEHTRRAADHKLFSMQAIAFLPGVGFLAGVAGRVPPPTAGAVRIGGDGRAAVLDVGPAALPCADHAALAKAGRARLVLTTPGCFDGGWRLPGMQPDGRWELHGVRARVVAAAVARSEVVSGWDLAKGKPKPALRVAPTGGVYWLEDLDASVEALDKLAEHGLWPADAYDTARRIEGFNRFVFAAH